MKMYKNILLVTNLIIYDNYNNYDQKIDLSEF